MVTPLRTNPASGKEVSDPAQAGRRERYDYEYQESLFMVEPLRAGGCDPSYPYPAQRRLDNLNTHKPASLYPSNLEYYAEFHYTPKHGSWPDLAG